MKEFGNNLRAIISEFDALPRKNVVKPKVGIVGEILVKFSPLANNHVVDLLESEGAEAVMPDLLDFLLYCFYNSNFKAENLGGKKSTAWLCNAAIQLLEYFRRTARKELEKSDPLYASCPHPRSGRHGQILCVPGQSDRRGLVLNRRDAGADSQRHKQHYLHSAIRLPAEPYCRQGRDQRAESFPSRGKYHCRGPMIQEPAKSIS